MIRSCVMGSPHKKGGSPMEKKWGAFPPFPSTSSFLLVLFGDRSLFIFLISHFADSCLNFDRLNFDRLNFANESHHTDLLFFHKICYNKCVSKIS